MGDRTVKRHETEILHHFQACNTIRTTQTQHAGQMAAAAAVKFTEPLSRFVRSFVRCRLETRLETRLQVDFDHVLADLQTRQPDPVQPPQICSVHIFLFRDSSLESEIEFDF